MSAFVLVFAFGCATVRPWSGREVLNSRREVSPPTPGEVEFDLTQYGGEDGVVAGNVHQQFTCRETQYSDVEVTEGSRVDGAWWELAGAAAFAAPGIYLLANAPSYSDADRGEGKYSAQEQAYFFGGLFTIVSAALVGHVTYLWLSSPGETSRVEQETVEIPAAKCKRAAAAGIDIGVWKDSELAKVTADGAGAFSFNLSQISGRLPPLPAVPVLTLRAGESKRELTPIGWWTKEVADQRASFERKMSEAQQACDQGKLDACIGLGLTYFEDESAFQIPSDYPRAAALFDKACNGGNADGCYLFGLALRADGKDDDKRVAQAYRMACDRKNPAACNNLGVMYEEGKGGLAANQKAALDLFDRACEGQSPKGCENRERVLMDKEQAARAAKRNAEVAQFRNGLKVGNDSHCGLVAQINGPVAQVQTMEGAMWLKVEQLYPPGYASCRIYNGRYVDP